MKVNKYILSLFMSLLLFVSCEDQTLEHKYYMGDSLDQIFTDADKIAAASMGMYDAMQHRSFLGGRAQIYVDARSNDVNPPSYFGNLSVFNPTATDITVNEAWRAAYRTANECNLFLEGIEEAKENNIITPEEYNFYAAEGKFIRSVVYFYALNFWGQMYAKDSENLGIPLVLRTFDGQTAFTEAITLTRSSIDECYNQIITDLQFAEQNLPETRDDVYGGRATATSLAAQAMLSRVYLYKNDNTNAINYANKVIGKFSLDKSVFANFDTPESSPEIIFFIAMNLADNPNTNHALGQHYGSGARADITVNQNFVNLFSDDDIRKSETLEFKNDIWWCYKYRKGSENWAPVIRYAEILLNKAEALVKSSNDVNQEAIDLLNQVRQRSEPAKEYKVGDFANSTALLEEILTERRRELAFEGHGSFDLFRNGKGIPAGRGSAAAPAINFPDNYFVLPIPNGDIEKADNLIQNKGY